MRYNCNGGTTVTAKSRIVNGGGKNGTMKEKKGKTVPVWMGVLAFLLAFGAGAASKTAVKPAWSKAYSVQWSSELGTLKSDLPYGEGEANKFDLYLPAGGKDSYGLAIYLHAGGFTTGDKSDDRDMLAWLCSKGYVAAGINYTLRTEAHPEASVLAQSNEIKAAVPQVAAAAEEAGYPIDRITVAGGSAGHTLAMRRWALPSPDRSRPPLLPA